MSDDDQVILSFNSYLIRTERSTILVDACCGNHKERPSRPAFSNLNTNFLGVLSAAGAKPEDIDYVIFTHLHWDHVGWNTKKVDGEWVPMFPNARYIMARREYEYWDHLFASGVDSDSIHKIHEDAFEDSVRPILRADRAVLVDDDFELESGISLEPFDGHSPGQVVINLRSDGKQGAVTGDVIHHRLQFQYPDLSSIADSDPDRSRVTRNALMEKHANTGTILFPAHFNAPSFGTIETARSGGKYTFSAD